ncbi:thiol:disulfide interchange protein DsbG [Pseudomonas sp. NPDC007930]|uniref:thiol:disulfide interchange protein DsbG n=1 Tax=Pseudomonas sp. NPDC007930 TaxID=3364417 RepID=UPI0036E6F9F5
MNTPLRRVLFVLALFGSGAAQAASDWPAPVQALVGKGAQVLGRFDAPGGLQGFAATYQGQGIALYLTADGQHVLMGHLYDAQGQDLSAAPLEQQVYKPLSEQMWQRLEASHWIADGRDDAARVVYVFSDPNCPYCNLFWQQTRPAVEAGKLQLRHVMVGIIRNDSPGKAAALLASQDPAKALHDHEAAGKGSTLKALGAIPPALEKQLADNVDLMTALGAQATPAIFYRNERGLLEQQQGAPQAEQLKAITGL